MLQIGITTRKIKNWSYNGRNTGERVFLSIFLTVDGEGYTLTLSATTVLNLLFFT